MISPALRERLRYPKFREASLAVALFDFGYFLVREVEDALRSLGHSVIRVPGAHGDRCGDILGRAMRTIVERRPDFFVTVNHFGFDREGILSDLFRSIEMPAASWFVDSPDLIVGEYARNASSLVSVFLWDRGYARGLRSAGFEDVQYLPLAADEDTFRPLPTGGPQPRRPGAEVGFVGNSMVGPAREKMEKVPPELRRAALDLASRLRSTPGGLDEAVGSMDDEGRQRYEALSPEGRADFRAAVLWRATLVYRLSCVLMLRSFRPRIHGDAGWTELLDGDFQVGPPLHYYRDLPAFYNSCTVNFNATSRQMGQAVNQRVFDVSACGRFLLTDHQDAIGELFEIGVEAVTYRSPEEIPGLVAHYLRNDAARTAVAVRARKRVLRDHTYRRRLERIVAHMCARYGGRRRAGRPA